MASILHDWIERLKIAPDEGLLSKLIARLENVQLQAGVLTKLFDRLEPLSVRKRQKARSFSVLHPITKSVEVFQAELDASGIAKLVDPRLDAALFGWEEDFILIFTNLLENSIYWLREDRPAAPQITIKLVDTRFGSTIHYTDNGPGIPEELLRDQSVFEPGFSTKKGGTGLGLAIAGEAAERNGYKLKAYHSNDGAKFVLELFPGLDSKTDE
jgi:signal transduction histidine kinase